MGVLPKNCMGVKSATKMVKRVKIGLFCYIRKFFFCIGTNKRCFDQRTLALLDNIPITQQKQNDGKVYYCTYLNLTFCKFICI